MIYSQLDKAPSSVQAIVGAISGLVVVCVVVGLVWQHHKRKQ